jgi:hypothetical protein
MVQNERYTIHSYKEAFTPSPLLGMVASTLIAFDGILLNLLKMLMVPFFYSRRRK